MGRHVDTFLMQNEKPDGPRQERAPRVVTKDYRVLLNSADNFGDFDDRYRSSVADRAKAFDSDMGLLGKQWLMIANPTYGSFDTAAYGHDFKKPLAEQRKAKWDVLEILGRAQSDSVALMRAMRPRSPPRSGRRTNGAGQDDRELQVIVNPRAQCRSTDATESELPTACRAGSPTKLFDHLDLDVEAQVGRVGGPAIWMSSGRMPTWPCRRYGR